jgi:hypothetical protein
MLGFVGAPLERRNQVEAAKGQYRKHEDLQLNSRRFISSPPTAWAGVQLKTVKLLGITFMDHLTLKVGRQSGMAASGLPWELAVGKHST